MMGEAANEAIMVSGKEPFPPCWPPRTEEARRQTRLSRPETELALIAQVQEAAAGFPNGRCQDSSAKLDQSVEF